MQLLPAGPACEDEPRFLQQPHVLHDADPGHVHLRLQLAQRTSLTLKEQVEQEPAGGIGKRLEDEVVLHAADNT